MLFIEMAEVLETIATKPILLIGNTTKNGKQMRTKILKSIESLDINMIVSLTSFIEDDDMSFILETNYDLDDLRSRVSNFFGNKEDKDLKKILKDLKKFDEATRESLNKTEVKKEKVVQVRIKSDNGESMTSNQKLVMSKIIRMVKASANGRIRTDSVIIKDKSKFFVGGVLTTLIEKGLIVVTLEEKKKFISITETI